MRYSILTVALIATAAFLPNFAFAQANTDLSNLENNLRFVTELRGGVYLGVQLADITGDRAKALRLDDERGVEVVKVEQGSPAESAGIKAGDVLLSYNGENILGAQQLGRLVSETPEGRKVRIQFWRDGKMQVTYAVVAEAHWPRVFPGDLNIQIPDVQVAIPDIPSTLLIWKNAALGIECEPVNAQLAEYFGVKRGVLVRSVENGSAAEKAGVKAGDVLTAIGDRSVTTPREVTSCVRTWRRQGKPITVAVTREHRQLTLSVSPGPDNQE
jgi:serine protease Do